MQALVKDYNPQSDVVDWVWLENSRNDPFDDSDEDVTDEELWRDQRLVKLSA